MATITNLNENWKPSGLSAVLRPLEQKLSFKYNVAGSPKQKTTNKFISESVNVQIYYNLNTTHHLNHHRHYTSVSEVIGGPQLSTLAGTKDVLSQASSKTSSSQQLFFWLLSPSNIEHHNSELYYFYFTRYVMVVLLQKSSSCKFVI